MTEVEVKNDRVLIQKENLYNISLHIQCKVDKALEVTNKVLKKNASHISNKRKQKVLNKLAEKAKSNPNYLKETKNIEDAKLKQIYRPHFGLVF